MQRIPLLSGSRLVAVPVADDDVVIRPPPPPAQIADTAAAVRDALRFPLSGPPLIEVVRGGARATIVVEPPSLPVPGAPHDPRQDALAAVIDELVRGGIASARQTILVAGGLGRRLGRHERERLLTPPRARAFRGEVAVHDVCDPELVPVGELDDGRPLQVNRRLVEADAVVVLTAAETILHGGPAALLAASEAEAVRSVAGAGSLLQSARSPEWLRATSLEALLRDRVALCGLSLVLDHPRLTGPFAGYPHDAASSEHVLGSPIRRLYSLLPGSVRRRVLQGIGRVVDATAAFAGPPAVAHAEALLRGVERRASRLAEPVDALVLGVPWLGPHYPREPLNPVTSAAMSLGLALRLWRDEFPIRPGGTLILVHSLLRSFALGSSDPYHAMFGALARDDPDALEAAERTAARDARATDAYRAGRACHPLLPYADWAGCAPALSRIGQVIVAGSRDAAAARALGFAPAHSLSSALEMAHGLAGGRARIGILLAPPYPPLLVGP